MNKYQEALDYLAGDYSFDAMAKYDESIRLLQDLIDKYSVCKNELCLLCGKYKEEHLGRCNGCKFYE